MLFRFTCSSCSRAIEADASLSGSQLACPHCRGPLVVPEAKVGPGVTLTGFRLERLLGKGGMGEVYLGTQISVERQVAVKVLPPGFAEDAHAVQRFLHEGRLAARLDHSNIVTVYEAGEDNGHYYLAMAFVDGESLDRRLKRSGPLNEDDALGIVRSMAGALRYAWDSFQLLHRDIKPANIMVDGRGRVFLMDLGLAKSLAEDSGFTLSGTILGTPHYMSPEQALGSSQLTVETDIYSLGATLYHLVVGSPPFTAGSALQVLNKHVHEPLPSPRERNPQISDGCDRLIHVMMAKKVEDRYPDWGALIRDIDRVLAGGLPEAAVPGAGDSMVRPSSASAGVPSARQAHGRAALARQAQEALARQHQAQSKAKEKPPGSAEETRPRSRRKMVIIGVAAAAALVLLGVIGVVLSRRGSDKVAGTAGTGAQAPLVKAAGDRTDDRADGKSRAAGTKVAAGAGATERAVTPPAAPPAQKPKPANPPAAAPERPTWDRITIPHTGNWALGLDGEDDYVVIPSLDYDGSQPVSVELVTTPGPAKKSGSVIVGNGEKAGVWLSRAPDGAWRFFLQRDEASGPKLVLFPGVDGRPVHVACVWDGQQQKLFINGTLVAEAAFPAPVGHSPAPFMIARNPTADGSPGGNVFEGRIECVRISKSARYTKEFAVEDALPFKADADTLCLLDFEEGEGDIAKDSSGNGHDGKIHGATWNRMWPCPVSERKLREVERALRQANPGPEDCSLDVEGFLDGVMVTVNGRGVRDISPLKSLKINGLSINNTSVRSLDVVANQPIRKLACNCSPVRDLSPLKGTPLVYLMAGTTQVSDLAPLRGMPLRWLSLYQTKVQDLSPLAGMPLEFLHIYETRVEDVSPLRGMPLRWLTPPHYFTDLTPLKAMPLLWLGPVHGVVKIDALAGMPLRALMIDAGNLDDLTPLKSLASLQYLYITNQRAALPELPGVVINPHSPTAVDFQCEILHEVRRDVEVSLGWAAYALPKPAMPFGEVAGGLLGQDFDGALRVLSTVSSQATGDDLTCARSACGMREHILDSFSSDAGKAVDIQLTKETITCEIQEVTQEAVKVQQLVKRGQATGRIGRTIRYEDLSIQEKLRRLGDGDAPELNIMRGLLAAQAERPDIARKLFEKAGGPLGEALVAELQRQEVEAADATADRAGHDLLRAIARSTSATSRDGIIAEIRAKCEASPGNVSQARKLLAAYEKEHGETEAGKRWIAVIRDAITYPLPGLDWTVPDLGMEFVWIKALKMWVGKYEVTNAEYRAYKPDHDSRESQGQSLNGDRQPVVYVSFGDACAYASWLTEREDAAGRLTDGLHYRLPTEEEFMVYAQCGDGRTYPWGPEWPPQIGRAGNYGTISAYRDGHAVACDVEQSWANPWGLYGVGGNVWEACAKDTAKKQCFGAWRGASWGRNDQGTTRCGYRGIYVDVSGTHRRYDYGFRLVLSAR